MNRYKLNLRDYGFTMKEIDIYGSQIMKEIELRVKKSFSDETEIYLKFKDRIDAIVNDTNEILDRYSFNEEVYVNYQCNFISDFCPDDFNKGMMPYSYLQKE